MTIIIILTLFACRPDFKGKWREGDRVIDITDTNIEFKNISSNNNNFNDLYFYTKKDNRIYLYKKGCEKYSFEIDVNLNIFQNTLLVKILDKEDYCYLFGDSLLNPFKFKKIQNKGILLNYNIEYVKNFNQCNNSLLGHWVDTMTNMKFEFYLDSDSINRVNLLYDNEVDHYCYALKLDTLTIFDPCFQEFRKYNYLISNGNLLLNETMRDRILFLQPFSSPSVRSIKTSTSPSS